MENIKEIYFSLCEIGKGLGNLILVLKNNKQDYIFYAEDENDILERIKNENKKDIQKIYISNIVSKDLLNILTNMNVEVYTSNHQIELKSFKHSNQFTESKESMLVNNTISLSEVNKYFKECFNNLANKCKSKEKATQKLINMKIIEFENANVYFTKYGKLIFEDNEMTNKEVIIKDTSIYNSLHFTLEKNFSGPLFQLINIVSNYLMHIIPDVQERNSAHSKIFKFMDSSIIEKLIIYCICSNDFDKNKTIEIELTQTSLNISFFENDSTILKKFFEYYANKKISYNVLYEDCKKKKLAIEEKKYKNKRIKLKIFLSNIIKEIDDDLDNLDFEIILFAKNNPNFTRKMIDQTFNISPRNSNIRIKKMIDKNILKSSGISKSIRYNINDNSIN